MTTPQEDYSVLDDDDLVLDDDDVAVDDDDDMPEDDEDFISEDSYTSDTEDNNPLGKVCDMPEEEVARYRKNAR